MSSVTESRRFTRRRVELTARLACVDADKNPQTGEVLFWMMTVRTVDVSDGGLCIRAEQPVDCGRRVVIELDLPDGRIVDVAGRIVWLEPSGKDDHSSRMGVAFTVPSAGLVHAVREMLPA
jgi:Tfp pilus assembly protein PilZ